jgi:hypothetical protein
MLENVGQVMFSHEIVTTDRLGLFHFRQIAR